MRSLTLAVLTALPVLAAGPNFFPLQTGNEWVYTTPSRTSPVKIHVGTPLARDGRIYYSVTGYADQRVWMRRAENGNLFYIDPATDQERPMTFFEVVPGGWFASGLSQTCQLDGQVLEERRDYSAMTGNDPAAALVIRYRGIECSPDRVNQEQFVENLGMVYRRIGSTEFRLVSARVGAVDFHAQPSRGVHLAIDNVSISRERVTDKPVVKGQLRVTATPYAYAVTVRFPTSTLVEAVVRNREGVEVFRLSDGKVDLPLYQEQQLGSLNSFPFEFTLQDKNGNPLPDGQYTVTAWLKTLWPDPQFVSETGIAVGSIQPAR